MRPNTDPKNTPYPTPDEIQHYMQVGRRLRSEAIRAAFTGIALRLGRIGRAARLRPEGGQDGATGTVTAIRSPLAAILSSAEILRDNPEMPPAQRARFIDIVLAEEERLERVIGSLGGVRLSSR